MAEPSAHRYTAPDTEACEQDSGAETCQFGDIAPHWVVDSVCREGGYDPPAAGQPFPEWSFGVMVPWAEDVMKAVVLADDETTVRCVLLVAFDDDPDGEGYAPGVLAAPPRT